MFTAPPVRLAQRALLLLGHVLDDQDLEIGPVSAGPLPRIGVAIGCMVFTTEVPRMTGTEGISDEIPNCQRLLYALGFATGSTVVAPP